MAGKNGVFISGIVARLIQFPPFYYSVPSGTSDGTSPCLSFM